MLWINEKMTDLTKKDAIHKLIDAKCFLERYSNPHDKWTEAINIGIEAIEIVMDQEDQEPTDKNFTKADIDAIVKAINEGWELRVNEILSKIRAEIEQEYKVESEHPYGEGLRRAIEILDKYKAESEVEDGKID